MSALYVPHQKKKGVPNIDGVCVGGDKVALISIVSSNETILRKRD
jgi:hypothetical protein